MDDLVTIRVDGREVQAAKGTLLWEACKEHGIDIPVFCYHTKLGPVGACRTCLVEQEGVAKGPITACSTPVTEGMTIRTRSPVVEKAQRGIFEFLLANHPLDCPICDRAGECPLQDQTFAYGPGTSRYIEPKRHHVKPVVLGPTIALDRERCVLCWRCVRFCAEIAEDKSIVLLDRGDHSTVGTFQGEAYESNFSGNVVELCPVGALTARKQRFNFRPWELKNRPSVCPHCPMGCNINISVRKNDDIIRFLSRDNPAVDDSWLCDRGRFGFEFIDSPERLKSPLLRRGEAFEEVSWTEALDYVASTLRVVIEESGPHAVAGIASPRLTNEDLFVFKRLIVETLGSNNLDHFPRASLSSTDEQNSATERLDRALMPIADLEKARTILVLGADPSSREPVMELRIRLAVNRHGAQLVVINDHDIALTAKSTAHSTYPPGELGRLAGLLAEAVRRPGLAEVTSAGSDADLRAIAARYLADGHVAVLYDDSFPGVTDKGGALVAVADLVEALSQRGGVGVIPMLDDCNSMGARDLDLLPAKASSISILDLILQQRSPVRAALILGSNVAEGLQVSSPEALRLRKLDLLVVHELRLSETAKLADVVLPAASFAEKIGTFTNTERRVQAVSMSVPPPGIARPDWQILVELSQYFDKPLEYAMPEHIWDDIRRDVPAYAGIQYSDLGLQGVRPAALQPA